MGDFKAWDLPIPNGAPMPVLGRTHQNDEQAELARLREMDAFKTRFLNMAAHELNTPLTPLRLQMHMLLSGDLGTLDAGQAKALKVCDRNVQRLVALVSEILDVARMQGGGLRFKVESFLVGAAVDEAIESFDESAQRIGVRLTSEVVQDVIVKTDRARFLQILFNLISNGLKFTPSGGSVRVVLTREVDLVHVDVIDTGAGLTPDQMARLFQPFTQVHDLMKITTPGTGLGLYISRGLAEAMGGTLSCSSEGPGKGSTFRLTIPVTREALAATVVDLPRAAPRRPPAASGS
jgi:signal transduction histidine kinase